MKKDSRGYFRERGQYKNVPYDFRAKTKARLREKVQKFMDEVDADIISSDMTVEAWAQKWLTIYKEKTVCTERFHAYQSILRTHIYPAIGHKRLSEVYPADLQAILNDLSCSKHYANSIQSTLSQLFRAAKQNRLISNNPAEDLTLPKLKNGSHRPITEEERALILEACKMHRAGNWVLLMLYCGLRPGEAAALQWKDIDFDHKVVHVTKALDSYSGAVKEPKTKSGIRDVPMPDALIERLTVSGEPFERILLNRAGQNMNGRSKWIVWKSFRRHMNQIGGGVFQNNRLVIDVVAKDLTPYCLRHTYCTDLQAAGVPINVAKELMGHADISITARIYTHRSETATQNALHMLNILHRGTDGGTSVEQA